ncbi:MAG: bifunctional phosphoribosylaminoimidazolecarboxamide formyltransferase/IMP cyclohydrolase [Candidatus Omnitrophica bacterium]|nr:bifunctional phosphoribosylaminoimidazolecarboxamide formyltransferase/IMP cyclohydrolase [Candidatus Omnitrophota bacterium]MCM8793937.1 bifunctional phosphoribosylaminoimidazolecarboxamide formyltransferase/IMP cyclohydrolase [Candidatus Omnitrophota bacterium]
MNRVKRALISVSDKTGIVDFAKGLVDLGIEILSTGGTAKLLQDKGIKVREVAEYTGFPEMLDGRVKTLHPKIHGGILAIRDNKEHREQAKRYSIEMIDLVVINLYPFEKVIQKEDVSIGEAIENIDIGGPSMLRSAAKNNKYVGAVCNPTKYPEILRELRENNGCLSEETKFKLAVEVFQRTAEYDKAIAEFLKNELQATGYALQAEEMSFPQVLEMKFEKIQDLRYGENPHQKAALYKIRNSKSEIQNIVDTKQLHGKELSFNNILDLQSAWDLVNEFKNPAVCIIKHNNPCGVAEAKTLVEAYLDALKCDSLSAFGGIVGLNRIVDKETAKEIYNFEFTECVIAPGYEPEALEILKRKKNLRIIELPVTDHRLPVRELDFKKISGGILVQERDELSVKEEDLKIVTKKKPTEEQIKSLLFADKVAKHVKSNAIVLVQETKTVGIGAGQMSRVDSVIIALRKAGIKAKGSCLGSDAFFPKPDGIEEAVKGGIEAIIQPGGSTSDKEIIAAADRAGICMVFTGIRHFRH